MASQWRFAFIIIAVIIFSLSSANDTLGMQPVLLLCLRTGMVFMVLQLILLLLRIVIWDWKFLRSSTLDIKNNQILASKTRVNKNTLELSEVVPKIRHFKTYHYSRSKHNRWRLPSLQCGIIFLLLYSQEYSLVPNVHATTTTTATATSFDSNAVSSNLQHTSLLICTLMDGSVITLDTHSGTLTSFFATGRDLLSAHKFQTQQQQQQPHLTTTKTEMDANTNSQYPNDPLVVPDLHGNLYQKHNMQDLELNMEDVLQTPVQICIDHPLSQDQKASIAKPTATAGASTTTIPTPICGIVVGTKVSSLYGMDASSGRLVWSSHQSSSSSSSQQQQASSSTTDIVVLQREDYFVQHISTSSGSQVWNVTLGRFSALDFGIPDPSFMMMIDDDDEDDDIDNNDNEMHDDDDNDPLLPSKKTNMPLISFDNTGHTLFVLDQQTRLVKWHRRMPHVIARVYGLQSGRWVPLRVVEEGNFHFDIDDDDNDDVIQSELNRAFVGTQPLLLPASSNQQHDEIYDLLMKQQAMQTARWRAEDTRIGIYNPPQKIHNTATSAMSEALEESCATTGGAWDVEYPSQVNTVWSDKCQAHPGTPQPDLFRIDSNHVEFPPPPFSIPVHPPNVRPSSGGLFLTWPIVAGILVTTFATAVGLVILYLQKKQQWLKVQASASTPLISHRKATPKLSPPPLELERNLSAPLERFVGDDTANASLTAQHFARSLSMPVFVKNKFNAFSIKEGEGKSLNDLSPDNRVLQNARDTATNNNTSTTNSITRLELKHSSPMLKAEPMSLEGIPLVRYSRYRSEFKELSPLGKGGFGSVFECQNLLDGRKYAIKKVHIPLFEDAQLTRDRLQRVLREVKILALLDHPNIVRYYTAWMEVEESTEESHDLSSSMSELHRCEEDYRSSKFASNCYSSSFLLTTPSKSAFYQGEQEVRSRRNMTAISKTSSRRNVPRVAAHRIKSPNPLGTWDPFAEDMSDFSLERKSSVASLSEYGFRFERTDGEGSMSSQPERSSKSLDDSSDDEDKESSQPRKQVQFNVAAQSEDNLSSSCSSFDESTGTELGKSESIERTPQKPQSEPKLRHILYIQMQLCGQKTLANFLSNPKARQLPNAAEIDIHYALRLFHHVARGVKYVHSQDLIHRDLKPTNCFMDDSGIVKVGDFGLSRETNSDLDVSVREEDEDSFHGRNGDENTAGVGTRTYASPEQIKGSDYDSSTDIYSLGFILFELTFPMSTGMERHVMFSRLRQGVIPEEWSSRVAGSFPMLHSILSTMLSPIPSERPSAKDVVRLMDKILSEYTIQSLDPSLSNQSSMMLLRVEAEPSDHVLNETMKVIRQSAPGVRIDQYGLRSGGNATVTDGASSNGDELGTTIIEFALSGIDQASLDHILRAIQTCDGIKGARQVTNGKIPKDHRESSSTYSSGKHSNQQTVEAAQSERG